MNQADTVSNALAIDSMLNYETVKYFGNEKPEAERFDHSMQQYEQAAIKSSTSLGWLNFGQAVIFSVGMLISMMMSAHAVQQGTQTIGDFVLDPSVFDAVITAPYLYWRRISGNPAITYRP